MASSYLNDVRVRYIKLTNEIRWDLKYNLLRITNVAWWVQMKMMKYVVKIFPLFPPPQRTGQARQPTLGIFIEISRIWEIQTAKHLSVSRCINSLLKRSEYHSFQKAVKCCWKQYVQCTIYVFTKLSLTQFTIFLFKTGVCFPSVPGCNITQYYNITPLMRDNFCWKLAPRDTLCQVTKPSSHNYPLSLSCDGHKHISF